MLKKKCLVVSPIITLIIMQSNQIIPDQLSLSFFLTKCKRNLSLQSVPFSSRSTLSLENKNFNLPKPNCKRNHSLQSVPLSSTVKNPVINLPLVLKPMIMLNHISIIVIFIHWKVITVHGINICQKKIIIDNGINIFWNQVNMDLIPVNRIKKKKTLNFILFRSYM